jgi:hypothetical protein
MGMDDLDTATCLLRQAPEVLRRWERRMGAEIPPARAQRPPVVLNPVILKTGSGDALYSSAGAEPLLLVRSGGEAVVVSDDACLVLARRRTTKEAEDA